MGQDLAAQALHKHANTHLWANPMADKQAIFKLSRLTPKRGVNFTMNMLGVTITFPTKDRYHAFGLANIPRRWLGIINPLKQNRWYPVTEVMNSCNAGFQFYTNGGSMVPMANLYMYRQYSGHIVFAIKDDTLFTDLDKGMWFRTYSSATVVEDTTPNHPYIGIAFSLQLNNQADYTKVLNHLEVFKDKPSEQFLYYVNGKFVKTLNVTGLPLGSYVDIIWDDTIVSQVSAELDAMRTFESEMDKEVKYIVSRGKRGNRLDYFDDTDFFVYDKKGERGVYFHRNEVRNVRQLTQGDYALPTRLVHGFADYHDNALEDDALEVVIITRRALGDVHTPILHCRLKTLYRLPEEDILMELSSTHGQLKEWQASNLEKDYFNSLLRHPTLPLPTDDIGMAYGYHGVIAAMGSPYCHPDSPRVWIPDLYRNGGLAIAQWEDKFTYTTIGKGDLYLDWGIDTPQLVHFIAGDIREKENLTDAWPSRVPKKENGLWVYRDKEDPYGDWHIVDNDNWVSSSEYEWFIDIDQQRYQLDFRTGREILFHKEQFSVEDGYEAIITLPSHFWGWRHIEFYVNGRKAIPDLEYSVYQNEIRYVRAGQAINQSFDCVVVAHGLQSPNGNLNMDSEVGFIENGAVSYGNGHFLLEDRDPLVNIDGKLYLKGEVNWHELGRRSASENGLPYAVEVNYPPLGMIAADKLHYLLERSLELDVRLKNYLNYKYPIPEDDYINVAVKPLKVISTFLSHVARYRKSYMSGLDPSLRLSEIKAKLDPVFRQHPRDITRLDHDRNRYIPAAHGLEEGETLAITQKEYEFLDIVNHHYLDGAVALNYYFNIGSY